MQRLKEAYDAIIDVQRLPVKEADEVKIQLKEEKETSPGFEFDIYHWLGVQHVVADYLSRLESGESGEGVCDEFSYAELFKVTVEVVVDKTVVGEDKWLTDMHQFLSTGLPPEELSRNKQKRLVQS